MVRRENDLPGGIKPAGGIALTRNPGVALLWTCLSYKVYKDGMGGRLIEMGEPESLEWWAEGRMATEEEIDESIRTGLPALEELARQQKGGEPALAEQIAKFDRTRRQFL
jgi:hypothetical protein